MKIQNGLKRKSFFHIPLIALFLLQACAGAGIASESETPTITVGSSAEILVPADVINFNITIGVTSSTADQAFERHKEKESFLAGMLQQLNISEDAISYQPMSIRPNRQRDGSIHTTTSQRISIKMNDFDLFINLQKDLIDNEFDNFSASFYSTEYEQGGKEALAKAVELARDDARIMAEAAGKNLGSVIKINHGVAEHRPVARTEFSAAMLADAPSMMDFAQTISVTRNVVVVFELLD